MSGAGWREIAESVRERITSGRLQPGDRLPGEEEVAREWGVSRQTAHKALGELQRQGYLVRKRRWGTVVAVPEPSANARRYTLLVDYYSRDLNFPSGDLMRGLHDGLGHDATIDLSEAGGDADRELRTLRRAVEESAGAILVPCVATKNTPAIQKIVDGGFPLVVLDRLPEGLGADYVCADHEGATRRAMEALTERGHRRIAFFSLYKPKFSSVAERYRAFSDVMATVGVSDAEPYARWFDPGLEHDTARFTQAISDALIALRHSEEPVTAVFCVQDVLAHVLAGAAERQGLDVPRDLEIACFNEWPPLMLRASELMHRIRQRPYEIGLTAARLLTEPRPSEAPRHERVSANLYHPICGFDADTARLTGAVHPAA